MSYQPKLRNKNRGYMNLIVWQKAMFLFELAWKIAYKEANVDFKLRAQFIDAAQSIAANISEGYGRRSIAEYIQYLYTALSSCGEALTRALGLNRAELVSDTRMRNFDELHYEVENRLSRLIGKLEAKKDEGDWISRIAEDPEEYSVSPSLQYSTTPPLRSAYA